MAKLVVANWKMNKNVKEAKEFIEKVGDEIRKSRHDTVICPSFIAIDFLKKYCEKYDFTLGAQNCFFEKNGAFTGEVSASMLYDIGVRYVILGHSERRKYFSESSEIVSKKVKCAIENNLKPIVCVGESVGLEDKNEFIISQLSSSISGISADKIKNIVIAYEPIASIGTGKAMDPFEAEKVCKNIRKFIFKKYNFSDIKILYGGSLTPENCKDFFSMEDIDGGLIGGASLDAEKFGKILNCF